MLYPYQTTHTIQLNGSHWKLFNRELQLFRKGQETIMWKKRFEILQNMENRKFSNGTLQVQDVITRNTTNKLDADIKS